MKELENIVTRGTECFPIEYNRERSILNIPISEDYNIVVEIISVLDGIVEGKKIWDESGTPKSFFAKLKYHGKIGDPPDTAIGIGEHTIFYRVGDFNSQGINGFELHNEDASKYSFVCFINPSGVIFVQDNGDETGDQIEFLEDGSIVVVENSETLQIKPADPLTFFHNDSPPFELGRVYAAQKIQGIPNNYYVIFLPGKSSIIAKTFVQVSGEKTYTLEVDGQGNLLSFMVT